MSRRPRCHVAPLLAALSLVSACGGGDPPAGAPSTSGGGKAGAGGAFVSGGHAGAGGLSLPPGCATASARAEVLPLDLYILLDRSGSMTYQHKWVDVTQALKGFLYAPSSAGVGVGLQYLPLPRLCDPGAYAAPDVEITTLPGAKGALIASLDAHAPEGETPMVPALVGALSHAKAWSAAHPTHTVAVLLVTDGLPDQTCQSTLGGKQPNDVPHAVAVVKGAAASAPKVSTYVIGVGNELGPLSEIAKAGDGFALFVDPSADTQAQLRAAIDQIRTKILPCSYQIPLTGALDLGLVNVVYTSGAGQQTLLTNVKGAAACGAAPGWYYDDPAKPKQLVMCPAACALLKQQTRAELSVVFGCATLTPE